MSVSQFPNACRLPEVADVQAGPQFYIDCRHRGRMPGRAGRDFAANAPDNTLHRQQFHRGERRHRCHSEPVQRLPGQLRTGPVHRRDLRRRHIETAVEQPWSTQSNPVGRLSGSDPAGGYPRKRRRDLPGVHTRFRRRGATSRHPPGTADGMGVPRHLGAQTRMRRFYQALHEAGFDETRDELQGLADRSDWPSLHAARILDFLVMRRGYLRQKSGASVNGTNALPSLPALQGFLDALPSAASKSLRTLANRAQEELGNDILLPSSLRGGKADEAIQEAAE